MKYKVNNQLVLEITDGVLDQFNEYRQTGKHKESGGILLGQVFDTKIVIDEITTPTMCDKAGQFFFIRNAKRAQMAVDAAWAKSNGIRIYLGEWHIHPVLNSFPSNEDRKLILNMLKHSRMEIDFLFMVIVDLGESNFYVGYQKGQILNKLSRL